MKKRLLILIGLVLVGGTVSPHAAAQADSIINSPHNLSAGGPSRIRATGEQQVCIFCHTPHNAAPVQPLWNRNVPTNAYTVYSSNSLVAVPGQPTGSSKLCLSCHDGTIALGSVLSRNQPIQMAGGITTLPPGASNLGTDLSDDHPISFRYDTVLTSRNLKLKQPGTLPQQVRLDHNGELQCTSCHDAHDNQNGKFLVMNNANSELCNACHNTGMTDIAQHINCNGCHQQHTAPSGAYLLKAKTTTETCNTCHSATPGPTQGADIASELTKISTHDTNPDVALKTHAPDNVGCNDCHESHTMQSQTAAAPTVSPKLGEIAGVTAAGAATPKAQFQYEVCFKCHAGGSGGGAGGTGATGMSSSLLSTVSRQITPYDTRLEFDPTAVSYHPVEASGKNLDVPSLAPGLTTASLIYCTDCHNSDTGKLAGGMGPNGPHGSNSPPLLVAGYSTVDRTAESQQAYALCYRCHQRSTLLSDVTFPHTAHVVNQQTPCSVCHDPHGISSAQGTATSNAKLINFDMSVVQPVPGAAQAVFTNLGARSGKCSLACHDRLHQETAYGTGTVIAPQPISPIQPAPLPGTGDGLVPQRFRKPVPVR